MNTRACLLFSLLFYAVSAWAQTTALPQKNLFVEWLDQSPEAVQQKIDQAWGQLFYGDDAEQRIYYPVGEDMAYIADVGNGDVRSEGMSYGLMIAVQLNHKEEFDRLWKWAKTYMYHSSGPRKGYFAWQCSFDGRIIDPATASDGEEWIAMALIFASHRWGDGEGIFNYKSEALALLDVMLNKADAGDPFYKSIFDRRQRQVVFVPQDTAADFTDPSYHLPAFYELWALVDLDHANFWRSAAETSREFFKKTAHPQTGLMPDYANFDGSPKAGWGGHEDFRFDAWRTLANVSMDYAWFARDYWQVKQSRKVLSFLATFGARPPNQFSLDGKPLSDDVSLGLISMAAVAGLAAGQEYGEPFVETLWNADIPQGHWRYYDGLLYMLGLIQVSGQFSIY